MPYQRFLLFLGAGASAPFGVLPMKAIVQRLRERTTQLGPSEANLLERLTEHLTRIYGDEYDLEKLLDVVHDISLGGRTLDALKRLAPRAVYRYTEVLERIGGASNTGERFADEAVAGDAETARSLEERITDKIAEWCGAADFDAARNAYLNLFQGLQGQGILWRFGRGATIPAVTFVTTNYDECLDRTFRRSSVPVRMGFQHNAGSGQLEFLVSPFTGQPAEESEIGLPRSGQSNEAALLKIHGSVNWWRTSDNRVVEFLNGRRGQELPDGATLIRREMNYPVATKDLVGMPYGVLYGWFAEALSHAETWVFLGYSFGDSSVIQMMEELLAHDTKLLVVGPHAPALISAKLPARLSSRAIPVVAEFGTPEFLPRLVAALQASR